MAYPPRQAAQAILGLPKNMLMQQYAKAIGWSKPRANEYGSLLEAMMTRLNTSRSFDERTYLFDERHQAVKARIAGLLRATHKAKRKVGICGQTPSDYPSA
ncbi:MAG: putative PEP-binding protein [Candidatus Binatia bacterium]